MDRSATFKGESMIYDQLARYYDALVGDDEACRMWEEFVKKHVKPNGQTAGSIIEMEAPIHASNVMMIDPKTNKRTRVGHTTDKKGKTVRVSKKSNENLD